MMNEQINIFTFANIFDLTIEVIYNRNTWEKTWKAKIKDSEIKKGNPGLLSEYGVGGSPENAIRDYIEKIRGKEMVINATSKEYRKEFIIPTGLCYPDSETYRMENGREYQIGATSKEFREK